MKRIVMCMLEALLAVVMIGAVKPVGGSDFLSEGGANYSATAHVMVTLPITHRDVRYSVNVYSQDNPSDLLLGVNYLLETEDSTGKKSFDAYFDGNYFSFSGDKMREYHCKQDSLPFIDRKVKGRVINGVHKSGIVSVLVPAVINSEIAAIARDSANKIDVVEDSIVEGKRVAVMKVEEFVQGTPARYMELIADAESRLPVSYTMLTSPGSVGEQLIEVKWENRNEQMIIDEKSLIERYSSVFATYRTSNYGADELVGRKLPIFSLPSLSGERYIWKGYFNEPTMLVFLREGDGVNDETIIAVKKAASDVPMVTEIVWIFMGKNVGVVMDSMNGHPDDYTTLFNGERFAVQCGITSMPTVVLVDRNGVVESVSIGYSPKLKADLMQRVINMR